MAVLPFNGIIAGCTQSNAFARAFLHHIMEYMCTRSLNLYDGEKRLYRQFVDDLRQSHRARTAGAVAKSMSRAASELASMLIGAGCKISTKSVIIASDASIATAVKRRLAHRGVRVTIVKAAKDLGVVSHAGVKRHSFFLGKRIQSAHGRTRRIRTFARVDHRASRLY